MNSIDSDWIRSRLSGRRGEQAELAIAMGIDNDKMSKILAGKRNVKASEIPAILAFFGEAAPDVDPEMAAVWKKLRPEERVFLLNAAKAQLEARRKTPPESE